ncbi:hypothetical protein LUZ63_006084 [Rhynchospora breviuscula]|uniref:Uncharacterized protein n=1 Tax=Rhynchospora breviuscula TaxID=2022672 RepID=A0A9Q0HT64_9POAL|nr:hypothetical protein LUZ63_006084 [Rhynchospora breviuscula]
MAGFCWLKPDVYPLLAAMTFATSLCVYQLARNAVLNPDVRIKKSQRTTAILDNAEKAQQYHKHAVRDFLLRRGPLSEIIAEARAEK